MLGCCRKISGLAGGYCEVRCIAVRGAFRAATITSGTREEPLGRAHTTRTRSNARWIVEREESVEGEH